MGDILNIIKQRKTTYEFTNKKISNAKLMKILEAGRWAPSSRNTQNWSFIILQDKEKISYILENCYYGDFHTTPPILIIIVLEPIYKELKNLKVLKEEAEYHKYLNVSLPALNMCLEATSLGISSFIASPISKEVNKILNIPKNKKAILCVGLGYESKNAYQRERTRKPLSEIVFYEVYGNEFKKRNK